MAATEVEQAPLCSERKRWVLKVPIDCAGCGKKVKKILESIDGVDSTEIELKQQKVMVSGNVDAETLIRRLMKKTKKPVGLWPEEPPATDSTPKKEKSKANRDGDKNRELQTKARSDEPSSSYDKNRDLQTEAKSEDPSSGGGGAPEKSMDGGAAPAKDTSRGSLEKVTSGDAPAKDGVPGCPENKSDSGLTEKKNDGKSSVPESVPENTSEGPAPAGGNGGKKKKKKGQKQNVNVPDGGSTPTPTNVGTSAGSGSSLTPGQTTVNNPSNPSPPRQQAPPPPPHHQHIAPAPVLSYSTARPTRVHGASYYAPPSSYSYAYEIPGVDMGPPSYRSPYPQPPSDFHSYPPSYSSPYPQPPSNFHSYPPSYSSPYPQPPSNFHSYPPQPPEFEFFSDENPNGCRVM